MKTIPVKYVDTTKYKVTISYDDFQENPLDWTTPEERGAWFVMSHRNYTVPNELDVDFEEYTSWTDMANSHPAMKNKPVKFVRWYEHSGIAVSLRDDEGGQDWDAGIVGLIVGETTQDIENAFSEWQHYVEGDIYTVVVETEDGRFIDSCGGLYGREAVDEFIAEAIPDAESVEEVYA